ncbi:hypothetical protein D3C84_1061600 [compost metagenome]
MLPDLLRRHLGGVAARSNAGVEYSLEQRGQARIDVHQLFARTGQQRLGPLGKRTREGAQESKNQCLQWVAAP